MPLIVYDPRDKRHRTIDSAVSLIDIAPTILSALGLEVPPVMQGQDLRQIDDADSDGPAARRYVYSESFLATKYGCNPLLAVVSDKTQYIQTLRSELYDLPSDPCQLDNVIAADPEMATYLAGTLKGLVDDSMADTAQASESIIDAESLKKLESLGYVGGTAIDTSVVVDPCRADPKDLIGYHELLQKATYESYHKRYEKALDACNRMVQQWPELPNGYLKQAQVLQSMKRHEEAIQAVQAYMKRIKDVPQAESLGFNPNQPVNMAWNIIGTSQYELGQYPQAVESFTAMLAMNEKQPEAVNKLAACYFATEDYPNAIEYWHKSLAMNPAQAETCANLAGAYYKMGDLRKAREYWQQALDLAGQWDDVAKKLEILDKQLAYQDQVEAMEQRITADTDDLEAHAELAKLYYAQHRFDEAIGQWRHEVRLNPTSYVALNNMAWLLATESDRSDADRTAALAYALKACELTDHANADLLETLAVAQWQNGDIPAAIATTQKAVDLARQGTQDELGRAAGRLS